MAKKIEEDKENTDTALTAARNKTIENARIMEENKTELSREIFDVKETQATQAVQLEVLGRNMEQMQQAQLTSAGQMNCELQTMRKEIDDTKKANSEENYNTRKRMAEQFQERDKRAKLEQKEQFDLICGVQDTCKYNQEIAIKQKNCLSEQKRETETLKQEVEVLKRKMETWERKEAEQANTSTPGRLQQLKQFLRKKIWRAKD